MNLTYFPHDLKLNTNAEGYVRTPGLHMSDIYGSLYKELMPERYDKEGGPDEIAMEYGSAFEEELEESIANSFRRRTTGGSDRPGEFAALSNGRVVPVGTPKSIIFSPDHFFYNGVTRLGEFKSTRMTIAKGLHEKKFDKWFCQMMAYGKPLKMPQQRLYALFINGTGKWEEHKVPGIGLLPPGPLLLAWDVIFAQRELDNNWSMLMRHATKKGMDI